MGDMRPDVLAGKYDPQMFDLTGRTLLVNEIFYSLQGEGYWAGHATVFIRLAKCNLACKFCDTEFETFTKQSVEDIVATVVALTPERQDTLKLLRPRIDITGGEPLLQNCEPLISALQALGFAVGCETSGSVNAPWVGMLDWVTCSPKLRKDAIAPLVVKHASEFKWVVNAAFLAQYERSEHAMYFAGADMAATPINYLQPESNLPKYITAATKLILRHPLRYVLSLQTHKLAGNP